MSVSVVGLARVAPGKGEVALEHLAHLVDIPLQEFAVGGIVEQGQRKLEASQDRAEVVADAVEHGGALLGRPLDPALHLDEGVAGLPHLARAVRD